MSRPKRSGSVSRCAALLTAACGCAAVAASRIIVLREAGLAATGAAHLALPPLPARVVRYYAEAGGAELILDAVPV